MRLDHEESGAKHSIDSRRKKLAALSFGEKLDLLGKLRDRSLMLAEAREKLATKKKKSSKSR